MTQLLPLVDRVPPVRGQRGRLRRRPERLYADRAYDSREHRESLHSRQITPVIAERGAGHGSGWAYTGGLPSEPWHVAPVPQTAGALRANGRDT